MMGWMAPLRHLSATKQILAPERIISWEHLGTIKHD